MDRKNEIFETTVIIPPEHIIPKRNLFALRDLSKIGTVLEKVVAGMAEKMFPPPP
jgi:hypothetical protein